MKRVLFLVDRTKGEARRAAREALPALGGKARSEVISLRGVDLRRRKADLVVVFGGDGSLLAVARAMGTSPIPTLGINLGRLGFLASTQPEGMVEAIAGAINGAYPVEERAMLEARISGNGRAKTLRCLNDVAVTRTSRAPLVSVQLSMGGKRVADYRGDGVLVATPTGSTGYNLAAGGPILDPGLDALVVSPICPHTMGDRPLVVPGDAPITLEITEARPGATVAVDGQEFTQVKSGARVRLRVSDVRFPLVVPDADVYKRLRGSLGWGYRKERSDSK